MAQPIIDSVHRRRNGWQGAPARVPAAALVAAAGAIHLYLWFSYFHRVDVIGPLFLANAASAVLIACLLAISGSALVLLAGLGYEATTLVAFAVSTKWGLFGYHERFWASWQEAAGGVELGGVVLLATALVGSPRRRPHLG